MILRFEGIDFEIIFVLTSKGVVKGNYDMNFRPASNGTRLTQTYLKTTNEKWKFFNANYIGRKSHLLEIPTLSYVGI